MLYAIWPGEVEIWHFSDMQCRCLSCIKCDSRFWNTCKTLEKQTNNIYLPTECNSCMPGTAGKGELKIAVSCISGLPMSYVPWD